MEKRIIRRGQKYILLRMYINNDIIVCPFSFKMLLNTKTTIKCKINIIV